jgi:hypothetical protein
LFTRGVLGLELLRLWASTGREVPGSEHSLAQASSVTLRFPLVAGRFIPNVAISSLKKAREMSPADRALTKANSSCFSITSKAGALLRRSVCLFNWLTLLRCKLGARLKTVHQCIRRLNAQSPILNESSPRKPESVTLLDHVMAPVYIWCHCSPTWLLS